MLVIDMELHENEVEDLPFSQSNKADYEDPDVKRINEILKLIDGLFTHKADREVEISDLSEQQISNISQLKFFDRVLYPDEDNELFGDMVRDFMRLTFSKSRKSRSEIITVAKSLMGSPGDEVETFEKKGRFRRFLEGI